VLRIGAEVIRLEERSVGIEQAPHQWRDHRHPIRRILLPLDHPMCVGNEPKSGSWH
jgi:hypothetical protein